MGRHFALELHRMQCVKSVAEGDNRREGVAATGATAFAKKLWLITMAVQCERVHSASPIMACFFTVSQRLHAAKRTIGTLQGCSDRMLLSCNLCMLMPMVLLHVNVQEHVQIPWRDIRRVQGGSITLLAAFTSIPGAVRRRATTSWWPLHDAIISAVVPHCTAKSG
jgi:hypothetical protein